MICLSETCSIVKAYMFVHLTLNKLKEEEDWLKRATLVLTGQMCPNKKSGFIRYQERVYNFLNLEVSNGFMSKHMDL